MSLPVAPGTAEVAAVEASEAAIARQSTKDTAREFAALISKSVETAPTQTELTPVQNAISASQEALQASSEAGEASESTQQEIEAPTASQEVVTASGDELNDLEAALAEFGVDLGVRHADIPKELHPAWQRQLETLAPVLEEATQDRLAYREAVEAMESFKERLNSSPEELLMVLALTKPDVFASAVAKAQRMTEDQEYKAVMLEKLESSARMRDVERKEKVIADEAKRVRYKKVEAAMKQSARKYNVDLNLAEQVLAAKVTANGGNIELSAVDAVIASLRPKAPLAKLRVATPAKMNLTAPTHPVAGTPSPAPKANSPGLAAGEPGVTGRGGSRLRSLVRDAYTAVASNIER